ncbi:MAG: putative peptidoglycan glycosyltransferase FtsW [Pseudomonadota bacterium]
MKSISRLDDRLMARWWLSIDRPSIAALAAILTIGCLLIIAASPPAASRLGIANDFHFTLRQFMFLGPALMLAFFVSLLSPLQARRAGVFIFLGGICLMLFILLSGAAINGAKRWIDLGAFLLQPSEFAKPGFVIAAAWMLAEGARDPRFPGGALAMALYGCFALLLMLQPDFGQWALVTAVWALMFFIAGWSWFWIVVLGAAGAAAMAGAYFLSPHVASRIDGFLSPTAGANYQVDRALETLHHGGFAGRLVNGDVASVKNTLPDAHTDFIFAVAGEEFGFILCAIIIALFAFFVARSLLIAASMKSVFTQCAVSGLAAMIGFQAAINIGVSLRALPAKGMTLPMISYGGSSLLATALTIGLIFALSRRQTCVSRRKEIMP